MNRRKFISSMAANVLFLELSSEQRIYGSQTKADYGVSTYRTDRLERIGDMTLEQFKEVCEHELSDIIIPMWYDKVIDHKYGGFMCEINYHDDSYASTEKNVWWQCRGLWVFSYLYNHITQDMRHHEFMKKTRDFLLDNCYDKKTYNWYTRVSRDGKTVIVPGDMHTNVMAVLALTEYHIATGDEEAFEVAIKTAFSIIERVLAPDFQNSPNVVPGTSSYGFWIHFMSTITPLCRLLDDIHNTKGKYPYPDCERFYGIARLCRERMLAHIDYEKRMVIGLLDKNLKPVNGGRTQGIGNGHGVEGAWMQMVEALRIGDCMLFSKGMDICRWHFKYGWDIEVGGGGLVNLISPENPTVSDDGIKKSWRVDDGMIGLMLMIEHDQDPWAIEWFEMVRTWSYNTFYDKKKNLWILNVDRKGNRDYDHPRRGNFHHPRSIMFIIESLNRQIARGGRVSNFFDGTHY